MFEKALRSFGGNGYGKRKLPFLIRRIRPKELNFSVTVIKNSNDN